MILLSGQLRFPVTQGLSLIGFVDTGNLYDGETSIRRDCAQG